MSEFNDNLDDAVDDIISQLKNRGSTFKEVETERPNLAPEDVEKFIIDNASTVVLDCVEMLQSIKKDIQMGADAKLIESAAELAKATTAAIDALSKLKLSDDKIKGQKELKQMDLNFKANIHDEKQKEGLYLSREELIKSLKSYNEILPPTPVIDV